MIVELNSPACRGILGAIMSDNFLYHRVGKVTL